MQLLQLFNHLEKRRTKLVCMAVSVAVVLLLFLFMNVGLVSKYLGTRSLAGLGAVSGQSLPRTCEFISRVIAFCYLFSISKLSVLTLKHLQSTRTFFGFQKSYLDVFFLHLLFFPMSFYSTWWPWRPTPTKRKVKVTFCNNKKNLGNFFLV